MEDEEEEEEATDKTGEMETEEEEEGRRVAWTSWVRKTFCMSSVWEGEGGSRERGGREGRRLADRRNYLNTGAHFHRTGTKKGCKKRVPW